MKEKHFVQLDGLRFFAVFMVMIAHWLQWQWANPILNKFPFVHGVILFFVLSGYLITQILLKNQLKLSLENKNEGLKFILKNFYLRRFLRIFPIYYLLLFLLYVLNYQNTRELFPWLISYTSNIYQSIHNIYIGNFNHFWSLAVEEQFYIFWPLLILFIPKTWQLKTIIFSILISLGIKIIFFYMQMVGWPHPILHFVAYSLLELAPC